MYVANPSQRGPSVLPAGRAARILGIDPRWLKDEITAGRLPGLMTGSKQVVNLEALEAMVAKRAGKVGEA